MKKSPENAWRGNPYRRPGSPFWSYVFKDASGVVRRRSAKTRDLRIACEALAAALREVEQQRVGHFDRYSKTRTMPLADLVDAYEEHLEAERCAPKRVKNTVTACSSAARGRELGRRSAAALEAPPRPGTPRLASSLRRCARDGQERPTGFTRA